MSSAEDLIDSMDTSGIDMSIVCGFHWSSHELCRESNDYILESVSRYPKRLIGLAVLASEMGDKAGYELERCAGAGIRGIGELRPETSCLDMSLDSLWTPIARFLIRNNMLCLFHASEPVGHPYPGKGKLTPGILYPFIKRHPGLKIILAHWGGGLPFYSFMPEVKQALSDVWFDTAASSFLYNPAIYEQIIGIAGAERVLFGSDYPLVSQKRPLDEIDKLNLDSGVKTKILGSNIAGILGLNNG